MAKTIETEGRYLFPHTWEGEGERLTSLAGALDPVTRRHIGALGVADGWRCLEVGAGTGTVARWLAEQVGATGSVLATDLTLDLMQGLEAANLELRQHDVLADPLPDGEFDLIHCRLVLEHLPGRLDALARLSRALAPGGWLVIEDMTFGSQRAASRRGALTVGGLIHTMRLLLRRNGFDAGFGRRLPIHLGRLGLTDVGAEGTQLVMIGGTPSVDWAMPTLGRIRSLLFEADGGLSPGPLQKAFALVPPVRRMVERRLDGLECLMADPEFVYLAPTFMTAWGRRPEAAT
ncbi:MAG TPA: class I SAM-dependent methyltransferase [Acidimicrobiia bacterium]|nr:class I SAM-dependent methyltransferase [Acidimicrobiia bacterium]